jgi:hypothetical protein
VLGDDRQPAEGVVEVGAGAQGEHVGHVGEGLQTLLLGVQDRQEPRAARQLRADGSHRYDVRHTRGTHGGDDRLADLAHVSVDVGHLGCERQKHVRGVGTAERLGERCGVAGVDRERLGPGVTQGGQPVRGPAQRSNVLARLEQAEGGGAAGRSCGSHDGDHLRGPLVSVALPCRPL